MIGLDIGSFYTKVCYYNKRSNSIKKMYMDRTPNDCINNGFINNIDELSAFIQDILRKNDVSGNKVCVCISSTDIIIREIKLPKMNEEELKSALKYEVNQYIPHINEYFVDYKEIGEDFNNNKNMRVMIVAAPKHIIDQYVKLMSLLKLQPVAIDIYSNSIYKTFKDTFKLQETNAIINIGAKYTDVTLINQGNYVFSRTMLFGGNDLTKLIADNYCVDINKAEEYKIEKPLLDEDNKEYANIREKIENLLSNKLNEITRIFEFYEVTYHKDINNIIIIGGTSKLKGIDKFIENYFKIHVKTYKTNEEIFFLPVLGCLLRGS